MEKKVFSLTTTLPYVNAKPHIGFAFEIVGADILCRYHRLKGEKVIFNTGTDEHGQKIYEKSRELGLEPQAYCDELVKDFYALRELLDLSWTNFVRTTDEHHQKAAQEMWRRCAKNGFIYKALYEVKYCVGCELEKTESELVDGKCPLHPNQELELRAEENYFFSFSKLAERLLLMYQANPEFVKPAGKMTEIKTLVKNGLKDFSISRVKEKMPWGVAVPDDESQVMYVWFDALTNYISTLGWPEVELNEENGWGAVQVAGKDNLRQQAAMWQAMLMAAELPNSKQVLINGFILVDGQKMSKSLGNVVLPKELVEKFGTDGTRWLLASLGNFGEDSDINEEKLKEVYTADLTNGLGNLCSRVAAMAARVPQRFFYLLARDGFDSRGEFSGRLKGTPDNTPLAASAKSSRLLKVSLNQIEESFATLLDNHDILGGLEWVRGKIGEVDKYLSREKPWLIKDDEEKKAMIITEAIKKIVELVPYVSIFMPKTAAIIEEHFTAEKIEAMQPLFPRL